MTTFHDHLGANDNDISRVINRDRIAAHLIDQANSKTNISERNKFFDIVAKLYQSADKIPMNYMNHLIGRAYICLLEEHTLENANNKLFTLIRECLHCIPNLTEKSPGEFLESHCKSKLIELRVTLRSKKQKMDDVRTNIGYCLLKMGKTEQARLEFELAVRSNLKCVRALIGLAVIKLNNYESLLTLDLCVKFAKRFDMDTIMVETINKIAFGFFIKEDYEKAEIYSKLVLRRSKNAHRLTESYHLLGKIYENKGDFLQTYKNFFKAVMCAPRDVVYPYYDLGLIYFHGFDDEKAEWCFKKCLLGNPRCTKTMKIIGSLYIRSENPMKKRVARTFFEEITHEFPDDLEAWVGLALLDMDNPQLLTPIYRIIMGLMDLNVDITNPLFEVLNNIAIIHCRYGKHDNACFLLERSLELLKENSKTSTCLHLKFLIHRTSVQLAKVYEKQEQFQKAEQIYTDIKESNPINFDAVLRNPDDKVHEYVKDALLHDPKSAQVLSLQHMLSLENEEDTYSMNPLSSIDHSDSFIDSETSLFTHSNHFKSTIDIQVNDLTLEMFTILMNTKPNVIWHTKGLGHDLASNIDMVGKLKNIFAFAENVDKLCSSWIHFAKHCIKHKQSTTAIAILETCLKLFFIQYSFKALVLLGLEHLKSGKLQDARKIFLKALRAAPHDLVVMNYFACTLQRICCEILTDDNCSLNDEYKVLEDIKVAKRYFMFLLTRGNRLLCTFAKEGLKNCEEIIRTVHNKGNVTHSV